MNKPSYLTLENPINFVSFFEKVLEQSEFCFFLESQGEQSSDNRYSIIGFDPVDIYRAKGNLIYKSGIKSKVSNPYKFLANEIPEELLSRDYAGGLVGYLAYEAMQYFEPDLKLNSHPDFASFEFGLFLDGIIYDKVTDETVYFFYEENRINRVNEILQTPVREKRELQIDYLGQSKTKEEHGKMVDMAKAEIRAGNTFQCQIGFEKKFELNGSPFAIYKKLREINPSPHMFYLKFKDTQMLGASPELLLRNRNDEMETFPLAGTIHRATSSSEDSKLARRLLSDPKEIAEHNMLIDLHRNDLGRVSRFGSVKLRRQFDIKRFSHVQHISSEVSGLQKYLGNSFESLSSVFPAGTLSGAPKIESMKIIDRLENEPRGPYGGAVGHFGLNGDCAFSIPIRTLFIYGNRAYIRASGGIVYDSIAENEYKEIENKMGSLLAAMKPFMRK
jgi:anthranilate synthase component I